MLKNKSHGLGSLQDQANKYAVFKNDGLRNIGILKNLLNKPDYNKPKKTFLLSEVERLLEIARSSIRDKERAGKIVYKDGITGENKKHYTLDDLNTIRAAFNKGFFNGSIKRPAHLSPLVIAFSMFKGGVGKTTQATHLAAHFAIKGAKVLLIDLDPQASATFVFGYIPSVDIHNGNTMFSCLIDDPANIKNIIQPTHYELVDIITSGLELQAADIMLPNPNYNNADVNGPPLLRLHRALQHITDYDVIILDCAPNHAATTMNALAAADSIILPVSPSMLSYGSSIQFIQTLEELTMSLIHYRDEQLVHSDKFNLKPFLENHLNKLFRILITNDPGDKEAQDVTASIRELYGEHVLPRPMARTIALARSSNDMALIYVYSNAKIARFKRIV